ncbi:MAG: NERD domain-containing protein [Bacteroidetes bacterium]|nr:NERD domain-containing protein [Bacteroidota bacterium]
MARMIPPEFDNINKSEAEKHLYYKLNETFDDNWIIFHSYSFEGRNKENKIIDAEIDFLLLNKNYGILILEVKGGQLKCEEGIWYQNSIKIKDPINQARSNKYKVKEHLKTYIKPDFPFAVGHAVCFPDFFGRVENYPRAHESITITGESINYLYEAITSIMRDQKHPDCTIEQRMFRKLEEYLIPIFEYGTSIIDKFGQEKRKVFSLTEQQCEFLMFIYNHNRVLIRGCAGSGKTIMAVKKAKNLASKGKSVLLLCYNVMLAENLALETKDYPNIIAKTYHNFCSSELDKAGRGTGTAATTQEFFQKELPEKFMELIAEHPIKFDAVIVDEGQDIREEYWFTIDELVKDDGYYYVFYDPDQNIFKSKLKFPELKTPFILNKNCRNTKKIFNELKTLASMEMRINSEAPEGSDIYRDELSNKTLLHNKLSQILHDLTTNQNLGEDQIVILGTHQLGNTSLGDNTQVGKFIIKENGPAGENTIPYYSCMKFKGLESDVVILLDYEDERWQNPATRYTAISRAKHLLYILGS